MIRGVALDNHFSSGFTPTCASCYLGKQRKRSFIRTEIRKVNDRICIDNTDEAYSSEIEPLSDHLRSNKNIKFMLIKSRDNFVETVFTFCGI